MHTYFIDGYNLLFQSSKRLENIQKERDELISFLNDYLSLFQAKFLLIFDANQEQNISQMEYRDSLQIEYCPKGISADEYILEKLSFAKNKASYTVVTSDKALSLKVRGLGAKTQSIVSFLKWIRQKRKKRESKEKKISTETKHHFERLLHIFTKKLEEDSEN